MTDRSQSNRYQIRTLLLAAAILAVCLFVALRLAGSRPAAYSQARSMPVRAEWHNGAWYWLENESPKLTRLVRVDGAGKQDIAGAEEIGDYTVSGSRIAWTARDDTRWNIAIKSRNGVPGGFVWWFDRKPGAVKIIGDRVYWIESIAPRLPDSGPFPPLEGTCRVVSAPASGGAASVIATVMEPEGQQVIGLRDGALYVSTFRQGALGTTCFYRVSLRDGTYARLAGAPGRQRAELGQDGALYWTSASREAASPNSNACVRRLGPDGKAETLMDWLPYGGRLVATDRGMYYLDSEFTARAWPVASTREFPRPVAMPEGYAALGIGGRDLLVRATTDAGDGPVNVLRMAAP